jgi:hypothetical protein
MLAKNDEHITRAIEEWEYGYEDDPIFTFEAKDVKWYESYDDVKAHHALMREAVEIYGEEKGGRFRFIAVGEDGQEQFDEDDNEGDLYEYITTVHELRTDFPFIKVSTTQE